MFSTIKRKTIITIAAGTAALAAIAAGGTAYAATASTAPPPARIACVEGAGRTLANAYENVPAGYKCPSGWPVSLSGGGAQGPAGPAGPKGDTGPAGPAGPSGLEGIQADEPYGQDTDPNPGVTQSDDALPAGQATVIWAACPAGKAAIGGGYRADAAADAYESDSTPATDTAAGLQVLASEPAYETGGKLDLGSAPQVTSYGSYLPNAWAVTIDNTGSSTMHARVALVCATVAG